MKRVILSLVLVFSARAMANSECAGRADDGTFVDVNIPTTGVLGKVGQTSVTFEAGGNKFGYRVEAADTVQYFEYDDAQAKSAMVGFSAFEQKNNPVFIKYDGVNFVDQDLKTVIDSGLAPAASAGVMRIWKGPGHKSTDQIQISKPVCSMWLNL